MTKLIQAFLFVTVVTCAAALSGCGQSDPDADDAVGADGTDTGSDCGTCGSTAPGDSGAATVQEDAAAAPDAGTAPAADAGSSEPTADAGGTSAADAGSSEPAEDAGTAPAADAGSSEPTADAGRPKVHSAPARSPASCALELSDEYIGGSACGELRGAMPGMTWSSGPIIEDGDGDHYLEYDPASVAPGTYEFTYVARTCSGTVGAWADYGSRSQLLGMTPDARAFVNCNWWDAASGTTVSVASPGCNLRITVSASCAITGAGNMRDYR